MIWASRALPYNLVDDPLFAMQFGTNIPPGLSRSTLKIEMVNLSQKVMEMIFKKVGSGPVCLGVDGWSNTRHRYPIPPLYLPTTFFSKENGKRYHDTLKGSVLFGQCEGHGQYRGQLPRLFEGREGKIGKPGGGRHWSGWG